MPVLGDALEEAGCTDQRVLGHCRRAGHCRGCRLVDLILGKHWTALVVLEEEVVQQLVIHSLQRYWPGVLDAVDGVAFPEWHRQAGGVLTPPPTPADRVDLLLTGYPPPRGRGFVEEVRLIHPGVRVLCCSGDFGDAVANPPAAGEERLNLPVSLSALARKVREVLDGGSIPECWDAPDQEGRRDQ